MTEVNRLLNETRLSLTALARRENVHPSTVWRWYARGVQVPTGVRQSKSVRLETFVHRGRRWTTEQAWQRFNEATTSVDDAPAKDNRPKESRRPGYEQAERELDEANVA